MCCFHILEYSGCCSVSSSTLFSRFVEYSCVAASRNFIFSKDNYKPFEKLSGIFISWLKGCVVNSLGCA